MPIPHTETRPAPQAPWYSQESLDARAEWNRSDRRHFPPAAKQQLRLIAAENDTASRVLLGEALNLLFVRKGKTAIL